MKLDRLQNTDSNVNGEVKTAPGSQTYAKTLWPNKKKKKMR